MRFDQFFFPHNARRRVHNIPTPHKSHNHKMKIIFWMLQGLDQHHHHPQPGGGIKSPFLSSSSGSSRTTGRSSSGGSRGQNPPKLPSEPPGSRLRGGGRTGAANGGQENNYMLPMDTRGHGWETMGAVPTGSGGLLETRIPRDAQYGEYLRSFGK